MSGTQRTRTGLAGIVDGTVLAPEAVPLTGVKIEVRARGTASSVTVSQRYVNRESVPVEAVYSFPLEEQAAVCGFEALIGDMLVVGHVEEKEQAFDDYDEALARGHGAYLLDQDRPNLFTASIGNLLPGQTAVVTLRYVAELERHGDQIRLKIPATVAPRYIPAKQLREMDPAEFDHLNPPIAGGVPYGLSLTVEMESATGITALECPSHPVRVSLGGTAARLELSGEDIQLDQDVVITFTLERPQQTAAYVERDGQGDYILMLDVVPAVKTERESIEAIFLIDRSGSMDGSSIAQARNALLLALRALQAGDRFNVYGFGSTVERLFPRSVAFDQDALDRASAAVRAWDADLGGTELLTPLRAVLAAQTGATLPPELNTMTRDWHGKASTAPPVGLGEGSAELETLAGRPASRPGVRSSAELPLELPRRVLVLTDGEVANEAECLALAKEHATTTTIFTVGVGYGASDYLVRGLARSSGGSAEFVHPNERIEPPVMRQMAHMGALGLREPHAEWGSLAADLVAPRELPPLYPGSALTIYCRVPAVRVTRPGRVELAVVAGEGPGELRLPAGVDLREAAPCGPISRLFARAAIRDLEEGRDPGAARGSRQSVRKEGPQKAAIVELARRYGLMSSETSFIAVEERDEHDAAQQPVAELRRIPVALLKDWHGTDAMSAFAAPMFPRADTIMSFDTMAPVMTPGLGRRLLLPSELAPVATRHARSVADPLIDLLALQRADGSWAKLPDDLDPRFLQKVVGLAREFGPSARASRRIVVTAVALMLIRECHADREDEWRLAVDKAESWLARHFVQPPDGFATLPEWVGRRMSD